MKTIEAASIDPVNRVEREIGGCKVRLLFLQDRNENVERLVLDNLMNVFERKIRTLDNPPPLL